MRSTVTYLLAIVAVPAGTDHGGNARFKIEDVAGRRPIVMATMNGVPLKMMVHSNASFFLQVGHKVASRIGVTDVRHQGTYGISAVGKLSNLGRDEGVMSKLVVGSSMNSKVPASIFETPIDTAYGMLGLQWIDRNRLIIDYRKNELIMQPASAVISKMKRELKQQSYVAIPMTRSLDGRFTVDVTIGNAARAMIVSTVAELVIDSEFAMAAQISFGAKTGTFGGPKGTTGEVYTAKGPIEIQIGSWKSKMMDGVSIEDTYLYGDNSRPSIAAQASGGALGGDFLIKHEAVVDFGNSVIYLKH